MDTCNVGLYYSKIFFIDLIAYSDTNFVGCKLDRKSTSKSCQILGINLLI